MLDDREQRTSSTARTYRLCMKPSSSSSLVVAESGALWMVVGYRARHRKRRCQRSQYPRNYAASARTCPCAFMKEVNAAALPGHVLKPRGAFATKCEASRNNEIPSAIWLLEPFVNAMLDVPSNAEECVKSLDSAGID